jgi:hypothetical protein
MKSLLTVSIGLFLLFLSSCFDKLEPSPPCFLDGQEENTEGSEVSVNVCCEPGGEGDRFCRQFFQERGLGELSVLAECTEQSYCKLCEVEANCSCLSNRDCAADEECLVSDQADVCRDVFGDQLQSRKCILCMSPTDM